MPRKNLTPDDQNELLTKLLVVNLWTAGASQVTISKAVGRGTIWVNKFLLGVPKPGVPKADKS
jgi:hypothetical protein